MINYKIVNYWKLIKLHLNLIQVKNTRLEHFGKKKVLNGPLIKKALKKMIKMILLTLIITMVSKKNLINMMLFKKMQLKHLN